MRPAPPSGWHEWYSICSEHREYEAGCSCCNEGRWISRWDRFWDHLLFRINPTLWQQWANRRKSVSRQFLERTFPRLRG